MRGHKINPGDIHIDIDSHNTKGRNVRAKNTSERLAVNKRTALKMFWDAGYNTEEKLQSASDIIESMKPATAGYWYADEISKHIEEGRNVRAKNPTKNKRAKNPLEPYHYTETRLPKISVPVSAVSSPHLDTHKALKRAAPHLSKNEHLAKARELFAEAKQAGEDWSRTFHEASMQTFGRKWQHDTDGPYISGIGSNRFSTAHKDELRRLARLENELINAAWAHARAGGVRQVRPFREKAEAGARETFGEMVGRQKNPRERTTRDVWDDEGNYGQGWETVTGNYEKRASLANLREYRENEPGTAFRLKKKREKIRTNNPRNVILVLIGHAKGPGYYTGKAWDTVKAKAIMFTTVAGAKAVAKKLNVSIPAGTHIEIHTSGK